MCLCVSVCVNVLMTVYMLLQLFDFLPADESAELVPILKRYGNKFYLLASNMTVVMVILLWLGYCATHPLSVRQHMLR
jgi:hypothetical protein